MNKRQLKKIQKQRFAIANHPFCFGYEGIPGECGGVTSDECRCSSFHCLHHPYKTRNFRLNKGFIKAFEKEREERKKSSTLPLCKRDRV